MRGGAAVVVAFGCIVGGLIASSGGGASGPTVVATTGQPAGQPAAGGPAAAGACVAGAGGLPAPGEPRKDSLTRKPVPVPANMQALYQSAGQQYGLPWELLAGVGMIETNHGATRATSSAGAQGPMQFMPGTWAQYGVDGNGDGRKDVTDPEDAVPAAAAYLKAGGAPGDYRKALFGYNRATWYVNDVLAYAQHYGAKTCPAVVPASASGGLAGQAPSVNAAVESGLTPRAAAGMRQTAAKFPRIKEWAGRGGRPNKSDHPNGRAVDAMIPGWNTPAGNAYGWEVARWQVANADALGITYVIWDDQVWKKRVGSWAPYTHPNGPTRDANLRHLNHVHVSYAG